MANTKNLKPIQKGELSKEEAKRRGKKGGLKSAEIRKEKKSMKEFANILLQQNAPELVKQKIMEIFPDADVDMNVSEAMLYRQTAKALNGDSKAFEVVRDTSGQKPTEKLQIGNLDKTPFKIEIIE